MGALHCEVFQTGKQCSLCLLYNLNFNFLHAFLIQSATCVFRVNLALGRHLPCCSCIHAVLLGVLTATVVEFHKVSPEASYLLLPYLGWTTFAGVLTLDIWKRNPQVPPHPPSV